MNQQSLLHSNLSRLSRRGFMRAAMVASAGALVQITTEADLAYAQRRPGKAAPSNAVLLDANENPLGPSTESCAAIAGLGAQGGRYHFGLSQELARSFAESEGLKPDYVRAYAGSSEPLHYSVMAFSSPARSVVVADPSYEAPMRSAGYSGAKVHKVPLTKDYAHDIKAMVSADPNAGVLYICSPNNPTGTITRREEIEYALANKPKGSILLVDEAYIHFADAQPVLDLVAADKDLIVLRTFSKIYGMAGLRCGFAVARPDLLAKLDPYGWNFMPVPAVMAAICSLKDKNLVPARKKINADVRDETFSWLAANNYSFVRSHSNCFLVDVKRPPRQFTDAMEAKNIYVGRTWPSWPTHVRVTVGTKEEMAAFRKVFKEVMDTPVNTAYQGMERPVAFLS